MGEEPQPLTTESDLRAANRGIVVRMLVVTTAFAVAALVFGGTGWAIAVTVGGGLAWLNFRWMDSSTRAIFTGSASTWAPWLAVKYLLRYVVIAALLFAVWYSGIIPVVGVLAGLGAFPVAVVLKGLTAIFSTSG